VFLVGSFQSLFYVFQCEELEESTSSIVDACFPKLGKTDTMDPTWYNRSEVYNLRRWKETMLYALLFQLYLSMYGEGLKLITTVLTGIETTRLMNNPMLGSTSPSDFWGYVRERYFCPPLISQGH